MTLHVEALQLRTRDLLHQNKLEAFATWACTTQGYTRSVRVYHKHEVLRLCKPGVGTVMFYQKSNGTDHVTTYGVGSQLVHQWLQEQKESSDGKSTG